jgi:cell division protein FtsZ
MLVSIVGGPDLTLAEVHRAMEQVSKLASADTHMIMGAAIEEEFTGRVSIMLIAAARGEAQDTKVSAQAIAKASGELVTIPTAQPTGTPNKAIKRWADKQKTKLDPKTLDAMETTPHALVPKPSAPKQKQSTFEFGTQDRGRFDGSERTIVDGEDLDLPTYLRKGVKIA